MSTVSAAGFEPVPVPGSVWAGDNVSYLRGEKPLHEYLFQHAEEVPERVAYIYYGTEITWGQVGDAVRRLAAHLREHGVGPGDRVALFMQNCPQYIFAHYAVQALGAMVTPVNPQYKAAEVAYQLSNAETRALVVARDLYPIVAEVRDQVPTLATVVSTAYGDYLPERPTLTVPKELLGEPSAPPEGTDDLRAILSHTAPLQRFEPVDLWNGVGLMTFTSGTTGRPKGAMLSYGSSLFKMAVSFRANRMAEDTVSLGIAPLCHIAGMNFGVYQPVYARQTLVILARFDPATTIDAIERYRVRNWYSIAPMLRAILDFPGVEKRDLTSLTNNPCTSFGIPLTEKLAGEWKALTGCQTHEAAYGLSETHTSDTFMPKDRIKWGSCGVPMAENEIRILDTATGQQCAPNQSGEIVVRNKAVFKGYWKRDEATAETLRDGAVYTGDVGYFDEEGYLFFTGRIKEMIKCSGYSVFPEDVEALMLEHPAISQSAAIGIPDDQRGETVKLFVVLKPEYQGKVSESELIDWAREHMAAYKYPRQIAFIDALPATPAGKVLRRLLKDD
ncbi:AMP-binding protein [Alcanivorax marinus]|uniref:AMP-binding protein n=1 Tax=Alloalcanivorax marinus TaxID=1177169 RepID=A0A9Q3UP90_9GAMM|nr:AMP-binding protein [Alloalcanivorax marinus]MCC4308959.1 AMP-binding protein [Alloalcanivorax marinus]